jgi:hypothetical protein
MRNFSGTSLESNSDGKLHLRHEPSYVIVCVVNLTDQKSRVSMFALPTGSISTEVS